MDRIKNSLSPRRGKKRNEGGDEHDRLLGRVTKKKGDVGEERRRERGKKGKKEERRKSDQGLEDRAVLRSQGARGMMNIKAGQAVRVDSTLSARGVARRAKQQLSDQYFLCENHGRWRLGVRERERERERGWFVRMSTGREEGRDRHAEVEQSLSLSLTPFSLVQPTPLLRCHPLLLLGSTFGPPTFHPPSYLPPSTPPSFLSPRAGVIRNIIKLSASSLARESSSSSSSSSSFSSSSSRILERGPSVSFSRASPLRGLPPPSDKPLVTSAACIKIKGRGKSRERNLNDSSKPRSPLLSFTLSLSRLPEEKTTSVVDKFV